MTCLSVRRCLSRLLLPVLLMGVLLLGPSAPALALGGEQVPLGESAPGFTLPTNGGDGNVSLSDYLGQWVVLYFYPKDFTPGCTLEAQRFQRDLPEFMARNTQVIGVSADDVDSHAEFCVSGGASGDSLPGGAGPVGSAAIGLGSFHGTLLQNDPEIVTPHGCDRI